MQVQALVVFGLVVGMQVVLSSSSRGVGGVGAGGGGATAPHQEQKQREARRRWQHALTGQSFLLVSYILPIPICVFLLLLGAFGVICLRAFAPRVFVKHFGSLLRPNELPPSERSIDNGKNDDIMDKKKDKDIINDEEKNDKNLVLLPGAFYFLLGTAAAAAWFPEEVARYAVQCLSACDPIAAYAGQSLFPGSPKLVKSNKTVAGCSACFLTALAFGYAYLLNDDDNACWTRAVVGALACTLSEAIPIFPGALGNDNLQIPVVTAGAVRIWDVFYCNRR